MPAEPITVGVSLMTQGADQFTGTSSYVSELLREFSDHPSGVRIHALCNEHAFAAFGDCATERVRLTHAVGGSVGASRVARGQALMTSVARPSKLTRQFAPGVSVVHYPLTLGVPRTHLPTVLTLHDMQHHDLPANFSFAQHRWRRALYDRHARSATLVVTVSEYSRRRIVETLGIAAERVVAIPHGVDALRFSPDPAVGDVATVAALNLPERFLFYPATLWPHKNHMRLLDALARVSDERAHLVLCGATAGRLDEIRAAAAARGIGDRVRHLGFVPADALPAIYRSAAALVFPSVYEGFGLPPLEAMSCGCPVASSTRGSLAEVCGTATAVLNPDDPAQMAGAISELLNDEALRGRLRQAGFAQAARFSWRTAADAHIAAYERAGELPPSAPKGTR